MMEKLKIIEDSNHYKELKQKIDSQEATIAILGLGYVGLPLMQAISKNSKFKLLGFDPLEERVEQLNNCKSYIQAVENKTLEDIKKNNGNFASADFSKISKADIIVICVPTPLSKSNTPDLDYVKSASKSIAKYASKGSMVILESTTYPGTTKEILGKIFSDAGFNTEEDLFLAFSPEREDPGNKDFGTHSIPKIIGATNEKAKELAVSFYSTFIEKIVPVSSAETAEAVKLTENIFRSVNIALVNELKVIFDKMGIDIWEVIEGAKTKPFGYMPFYPGPGLGGHCIPIDPFYLAWKAKEYGITTRFIELAGEINRAMPEYVVSKAREAVDKEYGLGLKGLNLLVVGVTYKKNISDVRESPSIDVLELLKEAGANVKYHDPHANKEDFELKEFEHFELDNLSSFKAAVICTDHDDIDWVKLGNSIPLIVDSRNLMPKFADKISAKIVKA